MSTDVVTCRPRTFLQAIEFVYLALDRHVGNEVEDVLVGSAPRTARGFMYEWIRSREGVVRDADRIATTNRGALEIRWEVLRHGTRSKGSYYGESASQISIDVTYSFPDHKRLSHARSKNDLF